MQQCMNSNRIPPKTREKKKKKKKKNAKRRLKRRRAIQTEAKPSICCKNGRQQEKLEWEGSRPRGPWRTKYKQKQTTKTQIICDSVSEAEL